MDYYTDKKRKKRDFWIGVVGSIVGNLLLVGLFILVAYFSQATTPPGGITPVLGRIAIVVANLLPWVLNIAAIILAFIMHRQWIALGILASYGAALALTIIAGIILMIVCFAGGVNF